MLARIDVHRSQIRGAKTKIAGMNTGVFTVTNSSQLQRKIPVTKTSCHGFNTEPDLNTKKAKVRANPIFAVLRVLKTHKNRWLLSRAITGQFFRTV
jgi:hypothetical protein